MRPTPLVPAERYRSTEWIRSLITLPTTLLFKRINGFLLANVLFATLIWTVSVAFPRTSRFLSAGLGPQPHLLVGGALGLLLVFRTNAAYNRFWEGRQLWAFLISRLREVVRPAAPLAAARKQSIHPATTRRTTKQRCQHRKGALPHPPPHFARAGAGGFWCKVFNMRFGDPDRAQLGPSQEIWEGRLVRGGERGGGQRRGDEGGPMARVHRGGNAIWRGTRPPAGGLSARGGRASSRSMRHQRLRHVTNARPAGQGEREGGESRAYARVLCACADVQLARLRRKEGGGGERR